MEIQQFEEFVSLVETCSFQRTAEQVNVCEADSAVLPGGPHGTDIFDESE